MTDDPSLAFDAYFHSLAPSALSRPERPQDEPFLERLFCDCSPLRASLPGPLLVQQAAIQRASHKHEFPHAMHRIIERGGSPIGRIMVDWGGDRCSHGVDIAVLPDSRNGAVGLHMLTAWVRVADMLGKDCRLSVIADNPARRIYERLGFVDTPNCDADAIFLTMIRPARSSIIA